MHKSEQINELAAALAKAQGKLEGAKKDSVNTYFSTKDKKAAYATLASVWNACRAALSDNGISVVQALDSDDPEVVGITTVLTHSSGQWMSGRFVMRPVKCDPQGMVSATTYARRCALAAMVGVAPEDDDDGEGAQGRGAQGQPVDINAKAEAQHEAHAALKAAIEAGDALGVWAVRTGDEAAYKAAFNLLDTKGKKAARDLETSAPDIKKACIRDLQEAAAADDEGAGYSVWTGMSLPGRRLVWRELDEATKNYVKPFIDALKKEAA